MPRPSTSKRGSSRRPPSKGSGGESHRGSEKLLAAIVREFAAHPLSRQRTGLLLRKVLARFCEITGSAGAAVYWVGSENIALAAAHGFADTAERQLSSQPRSSSHLAVVLRTTGFSSLPRKTLSGFPSRTVGGTRLNSLAAAAAPVWIDGAPVACVEIFTRVSEAGPDTAAAESQVLLRFVTDLARRSPRTTLESLSDHFYRTLLDRTEDGITIERKGVIEYVNGAFLEMFGYGTASELVGRTVDPLIADDDREKVIQRTRARSEGSHAPRRYEYKGLKKNGEIFDVEVVISVIDADGERLTYSLHRDISQRKGLERDLQKSEQMFRNVIDGILTVGDALVVTDLEGKVLQVNSEFERLTGIPKSGAVGQSFPYPWLIDDEMSRYVIWISALREQKFLRDFDIHWKGASGKNISVSINTTLLLNALGKPVGMMNMARDITSRKNLEEENRLQLERLRVLYELSRTLTSLLRPEEISAALLQYVRQVLPLDAFYFDLFDEARGAITSVMNYDTIDSVFTRVPALYSHTKVPPDSGAGRVIALGRSLMEHVPPSDNAAPAYAFGDTKRRSLSRVFVPMTAKDRILGIVSMQSYVPYLYNESHVRLLESFANLTALALEKSELYEETVRKSTQLQNRNKELDDFTYVVSHDLKEPLITVEGYSRILLKDYSTNGPASAIEYLQSIVQSCLRMKDLIDDLLVLSRVSRLSEVMDDVSLKTVVDEVLDDLKFTLEEKHIRVETPQAYPTYRCNSTQLKLVFRNLLSNAIKFNSSVDPCIRIAIEESEDAILCRIADNGIGIDPRFFDKIFVIFQRLHRQEEYEGSGAGLAIVKKIIEQYQGRIWLESEVGRGTTFFFTLPKHPEREGKVS